MMKNVKIVEDKIMVHFKNAEGLSTTNNQDPTGFWLSDESGIWKLADTKIDGEQIILSSKEIEYPLYVRYAFAGKPKVNLVNAAGLPAYPFRTDQFEN